MDALREWLARVVAFVRRRNRDQDFDQELSSHLDLAIQDNIRRGMSEEEARRSALISLGGMQQARELHRETRGLPLLDSILQDLRYGIRTLRSDASLAVFAVLIIGLGVGASSVVFNVVNALLLRPFSFRDPERLVWIANGTSTNLSSQTVQVVNLQELRAQSRSFAGVAGFFPFFIGHGDVRLTGRGEPERVTVVPVTDDFFPLLGVQPATGRLFTADECRSGSGDRGFKTALLSHGFWQRHFASDPAIVGRPIVLDGEPATVVGVLPESFDFAGMFAPGSRVDLFVPFPLSPESNRQGNTLALIGRLKAGVSLETAQVEATVIGGRIQPRPGTPGGDWRNGFTPVLTSLRDRVSGTLRPALLVLTGAVALVMLIVCVNLSSLLLARGSAREREMAIRIALGAGRRRLIQQMLTETLALSCSGSVLGLVLAAAGTRLVAGFEATSVALLQHVRVDVQTLGFALTAALLTGLVFGLGPALRVSATDPHGALKRGEHRASDGRHRSRTRGALVVSEIALACVLLTGAGLLMRSLMRVLDVKLGFQADHVMAIRVDPARAQYPTREARAAAQTTYLAEVLRHVRVVPGVETAGLTDALPLGENYGWRLWSAGAKGQVYEGGRGLPAHPRIVDDGYLSAMRIPILAGRSFAPADIASAEPVVIVNQTLARALWPGQDPLGQVVIINRRERRVVGVVQDVRYFGHERSAENEFYLLFSDKNFGSGNSTDLVVRSAGPAMELAPRVRAALRRADANLPATEFRTLPNLVDKATFARRFVVWLTGGFAVFALVLAALGIYGVISYSVSRRTQEIGIRMALGASPGGVQARVLTQTLVLGVVGMIFGAAGSWVAARALRGLLFGITFSDPATYAGALALLAVAALVAGYLPARRASRVDPLWALRAE